MATLLLATRNAGKIREIRELSARSGLAWRGLDEFPAVAEAPEHGATLAENARAKALYYSAATGLPALADDSGLEVDALGGRPGVDSAVFAGQPRDDAANNRKLIELLRGVAEGHRSARFRCCMALCEGGRIVLETSGTVEGRIVDEPRGTNGFGYDPHFFVPQLGRTLAELPSEQKNAISHRGQALREMLRLIAARAGCEAL